MISLDESDNQYQKPAAVDDDSQQQIKALDCDSQQQDYLAKCSAFTLMFRTKVI
jgi:hypothetical protein